MSNVPDAFDVCSLEQIQNDQTLFVSFRDSAHRMHEVALIWDGFRVYAIDDRCPHDQRTSLTFGYIEPGKVTCPLHRAEFDLATGECLDRYTDNTTAYMVDVQNGRIWIAAAAERPA
jgi:nitrite reductase/ring-hydroxylating ferredoxin subunit